MKSHVRKSFLQSSFDIYMSKTKLRKRKQTSKKAKTLYTCKVYMGVMYLHLTILILLQQKYILTFKPLTFEGLRPQILNV